MDLKSLADNSCGLVPVIVQNVDTKEILMLGFANDMAIEQTKSTGLATFWSRSRNQLWTKGLTSGNTLKIRKILVDCDNDTLLYLVKPNGPACHTLNDSCFFTKMWAIH